MKGQWKRSAVVATMLVLVGTAVFMNWKYTAHPLEADQKIMGESTLVSGKSKAAQSVSNTGLLKTGKTKSGKKKGSAGVSEASAYAGSDYFASARLSRQQARDNAISLLQKAADEKGADKTAATKASEGIQALAAYTMKEAQIENLVTAKGYKDCVAFMGKDSVSVVVGKADGKLTDTDVAKITDITMNETGYNAKGIKIMAAN
jgi:stage III sporulation protein AH